MTRQPTQLTLAFAAQVDPNSDSYRRGFCSGFVTANNERPPKELSRAERAGWLDGQAGCQVPEWRWARAGGAP